MQNPERKITMKKLTPALKMTELYDILGYHIRSGHPIRKRDVLELYISNFFKKCVDSGNKIPPSRTRSEQAVEYARQFLAEDSNAEKFWPATFDDNGVVWPDKRELIEEAVGHILRRKALSLSVKPFYDAARQREKEAKLAARETPKPKIKRKRKRDSKTRVSSLRDLSKEILEDTKVKPWREPPNEPATLDCIAYIRSLDPAEDGDLLGLTEVWLADVNATWPACADSRLQRFMHDNDFYISAVDQGTYETHVSIAFVTKLRLGTQIQGDDPRIIATFMRKFAEQVKLLSIRLAGAPHFVLEFHQSEGTLKKRAKFDRMWKRRNETWGIDKYRDEVESEDDCPVPPKRVIRKRYFQSPKRMHDEVQQDLMSTAASALGAIGVPAYMNMEVDEMSPGHVGMKLSEYGPQRSTMSASPSFSCSNDTVETAPSDVSRSPSASTTTRHSSSALTSMFGTDGASDGISPEQGSSESSVGNRPESLLKLPACISADSAIQSPQTPEQTSPRMKFESPGPYPRMSSKLREGSSKQIPIVIDDNDLQTPKDQYFYFQDHDAFGADERYYYEWERAAGRSGSEIFGQEQEDTSAMRRSVSAPDGKDDVSSNTKLQEPSKKSDAPVASPPTIPAEIITDQTEPALQKSPATANPSTPTFEREPSSLRTPIPSISSAKESTPVSTTSTDVPAAASREVPSAPEKLAPKSSLISESLAVPKMSQNNSWTAINTPVVESNAGQQTPQATATEAPVASPSPHTPSLVPAPPTKLAEMTDTGFPPTNSTPYAMVPPPAPFSTQPSASDPPTTAPNLERSLYKPITHRDPNTKTLEIVIESEDGSIDCGKAFPFQHAESSKLIEFFDFYSVVSGVPLSRLVKLHLTVSFGKRQTFAVLRQGDIVTNENMWKKTKDMILTLFTKAQRMDKEKCQFQVLVDMEDS